MNEDVIRDFSEKFEKALKESDKGTYVLRLFVTGITPNSLKAIDNIKAICRDHLEGRFELEVIDIYKRPDLARDAAREGVRNLLERMPSQYQVGGKTSPTLASLVSGHT